MIQAWRCNLQVDPYKLISAILPSSLLAFAGDGRVSLPDLKYLTALTELRLNKAILSPAGGQLPHLPALRVLLFIGSRYAPRGGHLHAQYPGPQDLGLAYATPHLAVVRCSVGDMSMSGPHEQLAPLAPLAQLNIVVLDFGWYDEVSEEDPSLLLRHDTLLSLPPSVTELVLCRFDRCQPAVALSENVAIVITDKSLLSPSFTAAVTTNAKKALSESPSGWLSAEWLNGHQLGSCSFNNNVHKTQGVMGSAGPSQDAAAEGGP